MCGRFALIENSRKLAEHFCLRQALMELLVKQLAIPLSNQKTAAKWLVISIELSTTNPC
jgi:putative SOS response-associated peptidase YedK